jgi:predicted NBD/HSP70 family sugar kinase
MRHPLIRRILLHAAPLSRAELAERTGLSRPAITEICQELTELGLVRETGVRTAGRSSVGRRRAPLDLVADAGYAVGILVAAENSAVTILDLKGRVVATERFQPPSGSPEPVLAFLASAAEDQLARAGVPRERLVGVGVSIPGVVDPEHGRLQLSPFFGWRNVPIRAAFEATFGPCVAVASPVQAIAVAELLFGTAARLPRADLVLVNVSTAVAGAFVLSGRLHQGADNASGQIGHVQVDVHGRRCRCGRRGCLDAVASGDALVGLAVQNGVEYESFSDLLSAAADGDSRALHLLDQSARQVGKVVGDVITMLNPTVVTISGMVLRLGKWYVDRVGEAALARAFMVSEAGPQIVPSAFGLDAGVVGSAAIALDEFVYRQRKNQRPSSNAPVEQYRAWPRR